MRFFVRRSLPLLFAAWSAVAATPDELALQPYVAPPAPTTKDWPRDRMLGFMRELADFVEKNHLVTDPARKTYGMTYEFWKDGKKLQEFGLDSMHDGAWFLSSLITAQRADGKDDWLGRAQKYGAPFYLNVLNQSDRLFPKMQPTDEDKHPWNHPVKGWAPRGWDDGSGYDRRTGQHLPDGYFTGSNHLTQDLADVLLNLWLSTRDPQVAEALDHVRDYKQQCFGDIPGVEIGAAVAAGQANAFLKFRLPDFSPQALGPYYSGLFEKKAVSLSTYDDAFAWAYRQATAAALISGELPHAFAAHAIARCYGAFAAMETYFDDRPYPYGTWFFDLQRPPSFLEGKGKLEQYDSTAPNIYGSRGVQIAWLAAAVLPELRTNPALWDGALKKGAGDTIVRMVDEPPTTDGVKDAVYAKSGLLGDDTAKVTLISDPKNLHVFIETTRPQLTITFQEEINEGRPARGAVAAEEATSPIRDDVRRLSKSGKKKKSSDSSSSSKKKGTKSDDAAKPDDKPPAPVAPPFIRGGKLTVTRDGQSSMVNEKGERILMAAAFQTADFQQGEGDAWIVEVRIPYTYVPAQNAWMNGVDFGRYRVGIDAAPTQTVCILSESGRIKKRLENGVLGTIDYWAKVWKEAGIIPSGWHSPTTKATQWEVSDAGGYAHLINAMALWLIYQDGHREWEIIRDQFPESPKVTPPLPASVLKAQGLE